mgnify:CR=1 FL=1
MHPPCSCYDPHPTERRVRRRHISSQVHPHARGDNMASTLPAPSENGSPPRPWGQCTTAGTPRAASRFTPTPVGTILRSRWRPASPPVHPHARGDNYLIRSIRSGCHGSPPRPWGQLPDPICCQAQARFTPTPVGTIVDRRLCARRSPVHPHARGDNRGLRRAACGGFGSPPRPWGQWQNGFVGGVHFRFTPTPVGTISRVYPMLCPISVHPHARGDNASHNAFCPVGAGSPPRPWGQSSGERLAQVGERFTPTPVGTMSCTRVSTHTAAVHPHARGDNGALAVVEARRLGSPPRPWGQFIGVLQMHRMVRFTPTPVGTIRARGRHMRSPTVHPHARGDNSPPLMRGSRPYGSPPRPWGQCFGRIALGFGRRFTPTPVGTMGKIGVFSFSDTVHPHARGDNAMRLFDSIRGFGSPPRPWGQCAMRSFMIIEPRFTPTPVGTMATTPPRASRWAVHPHARGDNALERGIDRRGDGSPPRPWGQSDRDATYPS